MVGQRFISLENHPYLRVVTVAASPEKRRQDLRGGYRRQMENGYPMPEAAKKLVVMDIHEAEKVAATVDFCIFRMPRRSGDEIKAIEEEYKDRKYHRL